MEKYLNRITAWVKLSNDEIREFQAIYKNKFNEILSDEEAIQYWTALIEFMKNISHLPKK